MNKFDRVREQIAVFETRHQWPLSPVDTDIINEVLLHRRNYRGWCYVLCAATLLSYVLLGWSMTHPAMPQGLTAADMVAAPGELLKDTAHTPPVPVKKPPHSLACKDAPILCAELQLLHPLSGPFSSVEGVQ